MTLAEFLTHKGESAAAFSRRSGVSGATVKRIKRNGHADSRRIAQRIIDSCEGLVTMADLFPVTTGEGATS